MYDALYFIMVCMSRLADCASNVYPIFFFCLWGFEKTGETDTDGITQADCSEEQSHKWRKCHQKDTSKSRERLI